MVYFSKKNVIKAVLIIHQFLPLQTAVPLQLLYTQNQIFRMMKFV
jgi:hypothetical protein